MGHDPRNPVDTKADTPPSAPPPATPPTEITLKVSGKEVRLPLDTVIGHAQKGLHYAQEMARLKADRAALESDEREIADYRRLRAVMDANQEVAQAMEIALRNPKAVLSGGKPNPAATSLDDPLGLTASNQPPATHQAPPAASPELVELRSQMADLQRLLAGMAGEKQQSALEAQAEASIRAAAPWLSARQTASDEARREAIRLIQSGQSPDIAATLAVARIRELLEEDAKAKVEEAQRQRGIALGPTGGQPVSFEKPTLSTDDLRKDGGTISKVLQDAVGAFFGKR